MTHSLMRSHVEGRTKTTFALPASDYNKLEILSRCFSQSIRIILDQLADEAERNLTPDNSPALLPITEKCLRKSYGISMKSKQRFEALADKLGCSRNIVVHTVLTSYCQSLVQSLQAQARQNTLNAQKLRDMCGRMLEIYEQPEYAAARNELFPSIDFAECTELLGHIEQLYGLETSLQNFMQRQQALTAAQPQD